MEVHEMIKEGIQASSGIAIAKAVVYVKQELTVEKKSIDDVQSECDRFGQAVEKSKQQLATLKEKTAHEMSEEEAAIFDAHSMFLEDPEFVGAIEQSIKNDHINAEAATQAAVDQFYAMFQAMDDPYFKGRAADIQDVGNRLLRNLMGIEIMDISNLDHDVILVAKDLAPSDTATMDKVHVKGFATDVGSRTSHTAIMARSLEIPAVLGLQDITETAKNGETLIVDGITGSVIVDPTEEELKTYQQKKEKYDAYMAELAKLKDQDAVTTDGHKVKVVANIGNPKDVEGVVRNGGKGIGLYRSEFLYMNSDELPDENKQFAAYKTVVEQFKDGEGVIIRTLDIGGDKKLPYLPLEEEMNPFLGLRAIRLCLSKPDLFKTQLRAILRASAFGKTRIMFPMIGNVDEVRQAKAILKTCMQELDAEGVDFDHQIEVGIMVEIPSAAITADIISDEVAFFSIGTNDLCQYTLAVDRMNQNVSYLYDPLHPAILRLVQNVIVQSHKKPGKFTGMCGEMAGDPIATLILLGLGLDEFSMSASSIPQVKKIIRSVSYKQAQEIADKAMTMSTGKEIRQYVQDTLKQLGIEVM
jgi:phosphotransferase system enzyme I (PtsI)